MALEIERFCPDCGGERVFYRTASMYLHLGLKTKWACADCAYRFIRVDGAVDTSQSA